MAAALAAPLAAGAAGRRQCRCLEGPLEAPSAVGLGLPPNDNGRGLGTWAVLERKLEGVKCLLSFALLPAPVCFGCLHCASPY